MHREKGEPHRPSPRLGPLLRYLHLPTGAPASRYVRLLSSPDRQTRSTSLTWQALGCGASRTAYSMIRERGGH